MPIKDTDVICAESGYVAQILKRLEIIATKDLMESPVLFTGETGSGKEMLADYLVEHIPNNSKKKLLNKKINCVGLPEEIIDSELFGHLKGTFTGAISERKGLIEESAGGVLFLDEIGVLSEKLQAKLLRVLEDREVRKLGDSKSEKINVRFIAATNRKPILDLEHRFRYKIDIPPLRDMPEEIPYLIKHFLQGSPFRLITLGTLLAMTHMEWEGNVRELKNFLKDAEISLEILNRNIGGKSPGKVERGMLFDIPLLFDLITPPLERYWAIRKFTTFDEVLLHTGGSALKKIKFSPEYNIYETALRLQKEGGYELVSINKTTGKRYSFRVEREDDLCLEINEDFPADAAKLIRIHASILDEDTEDRLNYLINNPENFRAQIAGLSLGIRLKRGLISAPDGKKNHLDLFEQPWKQATPNFRKAYWRNLHSSNPDLLNKQYAKMMGITDQYYQNLKRQFNEKAPKPSANETLV